jgi:hypothetical protein
MPTCLQQTERIQLKASFKIAMAVLPMTVLSAAQAADSIVGTWRLVSWVEEETENKIKRKHFDDNPNGLVIFTGDGHMSNIFTNSERKPPAAPRPTDEEATQLYRTMVAFSGSYKTESNKLTFYPEVSWNQAWNGTEQTRFFEVQGDRLQWKTALLLSPFDGKQVVATLVWERAK